MCIIFKFGQKLRIGWHLKSFVYVALVVIFFFNFDPLRHLEKYHNEDHLANIILISRH